METLFLMLDTAALMVVLYFSYRSEHTPGQPELGPFRIRGPRLAPKAAPQQPNGRAVPARPARR